MDPITQFLFPATAAYDASGLQLGGCAVADLAATYGTPLYIYDVATMNTAASTYSSALRQSYPGDWQVAYAAKAWLSTATARWADAQGLGLDVVSGGELAIALRAGFPADRIHFHGNNKTPAELAEALASDVGSIVVDHPGELALLDKLARGQGRRQAIWLRINPDVRRGHPRPHPHRPRHLEVRTVSGRRNGRGRGPPSAAARERAPDRAALPRRQPIS